MTIKELFKSMEQANKFADCCGEERYFIRMSDEYAANEFETYKEYKKFIKEQYIDSVSVALTNPEVLQSKDKGLFKIVYDYYDNFAEYHHNHEIFLEVCIR